MQRKFYSILNRPMIIRMRARGFLPLVLTMAVWNGMAADVRVDTPAALRQTISAATPGTRILIAPGRYAGGFSFSRVRGETNRPIVITAEDPQNPPVFDGGQAAFHFSGPAFLELHYLTIRNMRGGGLNIDDASDRTNLAHHIVLRGLKVSDVGPQGNRDGIKLSGVADFVVEQCTVERWGANGSGIDMVGCHRGLIRSNVFRHVHPAGDNGVQTKGGSSNIVIRHNRFEDAGQRGVNIGGSTGLQFFRPPLASRENAEARDIIVEVNTFHGSSAALAFVGVDGAIVRSNIIQRPRRWAFRILQETTDPRFVPSRNGVFSDNVIVFDSTAWAEGGVNIGGGTAPETFSFERNWWYCADQPGRSKPRLPSPEREGVYGRRPAGF